RAVRVWRKRERTNLVSAVASQGRGREPPPVAGDDKRRDAGDDERGSDHVQPPARAIGVLREVERIELAKGREPRHRASSFWSGGNRITSRIDGESVSSITRRSMPMPSPAVGGKPY